MDFPIYYDQLWDLFGNPREPSFFTSHIGLIDLKEFKDILCHVPELRQAEPYFGFMGNMLIEEPIKKALRLVRHEGIAYEIISLDCFQEPTVRKGGKGLSPRCWGLAVEIGDSIHSDRFVRCFQASGFEWGGSYFPQEPGLFSLAWTKKNNGAIPFEGRSYG
jgi:hypothetical protein